DQGRGSHVHTLRGGDGEDVVERPRHDLAEAADYLVLRPEVLLDVLDPLEVAHGDAAGVGEDVGDDEHAALPKDPVGVQVRRVVGAFDDDLRLDERRVLAGYRPLHSSGNQDVARHEEQVRTRDVVGVGVTL